MATKKPQGPVDNKVMKDAQKVASMLIKEKQIMVLTVDGPWAASSAGVTCKVYVKYPSGDLKETVMDLVAIPREFAETLIDNHYATLAQAANKWMYQPQAAKKPRLDSPNLLTHALPQGLGSLRAMGGHVPIHPHPPISAASTIPTPGGVYTASMSNPSGVFSAASVDAYSAAAMNASSGISVPEISLSVDGLDLFPPVSSLATAATPEPSTGTTQYHPQTSDPPAPNPEPNPPADHSYNQQTPSTLPQYPPSTSDPPAPSDPHSYGQPDPSTASQYPPSTSDPAASSDAPSYGHPAPSTAGPEPTAVHNGTEDATELSYHHDIQTAGLQQHDLSGVNGAQQVLGDVGQTLHDHGAAG